MKKWTVKLFRESKGKQKLACLTAYDAVIARLLDATDIPLLLVGDSLGNTTLGYENTLPVTMDQMVHHTSAVARGARNALVVADLPFMSYQVNDDEAVRNAGRLLQEAGADAVKLEGGRIRARLVRRLVENGIPVMGHIGLLPQSVQAAGGHFVQGRQPDAAEGILSDALALEAAGAFSVVLECIPADLARKITAKIAIPTIGIGAGAHCDGQVLVLNDMLALDPSQRMAKFVRHFAAIGERIQEAGRAYAEAVAAGDFPAEHESYD